MITAIIFIVLGIIYLIPGYIFGMFAWDEQVTSFTDYIMRVLLHFIMAVLWLPILLWCISPWSIDSSWKEYFKNCNESEEFLRKIFGTRYDSMMKKYGKYMSKNNKC